MTSQEIRRKFLDYFKAKKHAKIASSPVIPHDDPSLLFINAGMNQFKDVFLGRAERDYQSAATAQKCIRVGGKHNDLDNVGHTSRHLTFFEMLGNFSFGDYFKEKAIQYAWEVMTEIYGFSPDQVWVTVFETDEEAFSLWQKYMPKNRIVRMGEKDNFWAMGETGPCGPCSELLFDRGKKYGNAASPKEDASGERYLEFWNLVFMQYNRDASGKLTPLPRPCIDTGSGLERVVSLKMGVQSVFLTDILRSLIGAVEEVFHKKYLPDDLQLAPAFHVIADHIRSLSFAIADGAQPSNIERGYVLRKLIRRAVRYGRGLGMQEPFLAKILPRLIDTMGSDYPELVSSHQRIAEILTLEEEAFLRTLKKGGNILNTIIDKAAKSPLKEISGQEAFKLKDTYGFPLEEILLIAKDTGLQVNLDAYQLLEEQAKEKSRSAQTQVSQQAEESLFKDFVLKFGGSEFVGYTEIAAEGTILAIVREGQFVETLSQGESAMILLDKTPFYAEMGGQVGDTGTLSHQKAHFVVTDCHHPFPGVIAHIGTLESGVLMRGEPVSAKIDAKRRDEIALHHTATHLLHWALVKILGEHIRQAGSLVERSRLRFDFTHHKALSNEEMRDIERLVNEKIRENASVKTYELTYEEAQKKREIKQFFGEKYGAKVRVVDIDYSKELCGGTHAPSLANIGLFRIVKESSIASGVRRIEAVVGTQALEWLYQNEDLVQQACALIKTAPSQMKEKISALLEENRVLQGEIKGFKLTRIRSLADELAPKTHQAGKIPLLTAETDLDGEGLALLADSLIQKKTSLVLILAAKLPDRCQLLIRVTPDLVQKGVQAGALIKEIAPLIGGSGGGKADSAQAGGKNSAGIGAAFEKAETLLQKL